MEVVKKIRYCFIFLLFQPFLRVLAISLDQEPTLDLDPYSHRYSKSNLPSLFSFERLSLTTKKLALKLGIKLTYAKMMFQ
jgi:hypothetical protein